MSRTKGENRDLVSVSVDGSHEEQGKHTSVISLLPQINPTVYLTATYNSNHKSVHTYDDEEDDLPTWNLSSTNYE